ncbi:MAG TPA: LysE family translocator [Microlunatus sp.]
MVSTARMLTYLLTVIVVIAIPGPSVLFTISRAISVGRRAALFSVIGNAIGCCLQVVAVAVGLGALMVRAAEVVTVLKFVGAGYLIFLGVQAFRHRGRMAEALAAEVPPISALRAVADGALVGATNPKVIVFLVVSLPAVTDPAAGLPIQLQMLIMGGIFPMIAVLMDSTWALAAGTVRHWFARSPRRMSAVGGAGGLAMIGLGIGIAGSGRQP